MGVAKHVHTVRDWVVAIGTAIAMSVRLSTGPDVAVSRAGQVAMLALALAAGLALLERRRRPRTATAVAVTASGLYALIAGPVVPIAGWVGIVVAARHLSPVTVAVRGAVAAAVGVLLGTAAAALLHDRTSALPLAVSLTVVVLLAALVARLQAERRQTQRRQQLAERDQAVTGERLRIARDLHDLVGQGLSTISMQSGAARLALDAGDSDTARRAVCAVEEASRGALTEMRQLLAVLREGESEAAPAPGLDRVDALTEAARVAGHQVSVDREGRLDDVPAAVSLTAYRVLQEALTNATRHAAGAPIAITLRAGEDNLTIEVTDNGPGGTGGTGGTGVPADRDQERDRDRPSFGLLGLRERVDAAGGTLVAGPRDDAPGWRLTSQLPLREESAP